MIRDLLLGILFVVVVILGVWLAGGIGAEVGARPLQGEPYVATWYGTEADSEFRADGSVYDRADPSKIAVPLWSMTTGTWGWGGSRVLLPRGYPESPWVPGIRNRYRPRWPLGTQLRLEGAFGMVALVTVADTCGGCGAWHVDLPPSLFVQFAPLAHGWTWVWIQVYTG